MYQILALLPLVVIDCLAMEAYWNMLAHSLEFNLFIKDMANYTGASSLFICSDETQDANAINILVYENSTLWLKILRLDESNLVQALRDKDGHPSLILFMHDTSLTISTLIKLMNNTDVLDRASWLIFQWSHNDDLPQFHVAPDLRLFIANVFMSKEKDPLKIALSYAYMDYKVHTRRTMHLGNWSKRYGLHAKIPFRKCCYNLESYPINVVYFKGHDVFCKVDYKNNHLMVKGIFCEIFDTMAKYLKLRYTLYSSPDGTYGNYDKSNNGTGMIRELFLQKADIIVSPMRMTKGRKTAVDYTVPIVESSVSVIYKKAGSQSEFAFHLKPFTTWTWILVISIPTAFIVIVLSMEFVVLEKNRHGLKLLELWGNLLNQGAYDNASTTSGLVSRLSFLLLGTILSVCYGCKLISQKTIVLEDHPFTSLGELAKHETYQPLIWGSTGVFLNIKGEYREIWNSISKNLDRHTINTEEELWKELNSASVGYIATKVYLQNLARKDPSLRIIKEEYMREYYYFCMRKQLPIARIVNNMIVDMKENGMIKKIVSSYIRKPKANKIKTPQEIQLVQITIPAIILTIGLIFTIVLVFIENLFAKLNK